MKQDEIEHIWKVASNNPNHDSNWHDPVVIAFAKLVAMRTLEGTYDEMIDIVRKDEREACAEMCKKHADVYGAFEPTPSFQAAWAACIDLRDQILARGEA